MRSACRGSRRPRRCGAGAHRLAPARHHPRSPRPGIAPLRRPHRARRGRLPRSACSARRGPRSMPGLRSSAYSHAREKVQSRRTVTPRRSSPRRSPRASGRRRTSSTTRAFRGSNCASFSTACRRRRDRASGSAGQPLVERHLGATAPAFGAPWCGRDRRGSGASPRRRPRRSARGSRRQGRSGRRGAGRPRARGRSSAACDRAAASHVAMGEAPQLLINEPGELLEGSAIALAPCGQQSGHFPGAAPLVAHFAPAWDFRRSP